MQVWIKSCYNFGSHEHCLAKISKKMYTRVYVCTTEMGN